MSLSGEEQAWDELAKLDPESVGTNAGVVFDQERSTYMVTCFGQDIFVCLEDRSIYANSPSGDLLAGELSGYTRLPVLRYLIHAKDVPLSGQLVRPDDLSGGGIFSKGTHVVPLDRIAERFSNRPDDFFGRGNKFGGMPLDYGDMSLKFLPLPRIPVVLIVWSEDEEFPSKASLLFDSTCAVHMSTDTLWSTAMMTVGIMLVNMGG